MEIILSKVAEFKKLAPVKGEVLQDEQAIENRKLKLIKGEQYKKYNIQTFLLIETKDGEKQVKSIIQFVNPKKIALNGNVEIPISCIKDVNYNY